MTSKSANKTKSPVRGQGPERLLFRYRRSDTITGVSRKTTARVAQTLGLTETQTIHLALARLAQETLPRYEANNGGLTVKQLRAIRKLEPQGRMVTDENLFA